MLLYVSNGKEIAVKNWIQLQEDYASHLTHAKLLKLECIIISLTLLVKR
jgi:hypothetical protein